MSNDFIFGKFRICDLRISRNKRMLCSEYLDINYSSNNILDQNQDEVQSSYQNQNKNDNQCQQEDKNEHRRDRIKFKGYIIEPKLEEVFPISS